ncbi:MAG: TetR/AcrR family transcriptional regulator [bacterium]|nr:TetR/AcrR family transcriptional regulator [bacterium]
MSEPSTTRERILEASRQLFNRQGYANTTIANIAAEVGIAEGNLWYHFRTKRELASELEVQVRQAVRAIRDAYPSGSSVADDYVAAVLFSMSHKWAYRFLLRDQLDLSKDRSPIRRDPDMTADFDAARDALDRMKKEGMFRRDLSVDLDVLAQSLWIVSRYWTEYLQEHEGLEDIEWTDQQRGFEHHFAVLFPYLTAAARRSLEAALLRVSGELAARSAI